MFTGEYQHNIDSKGRIAVPSRFRSELGNSVVLNRGMDGCLTLYSLEGWQKQYEALMELNQNKENVRKYVRSMTSKAFEQQFDVQGRIIIPSTLMSLAGLEKECVFTGVGNKIELWSKDRWDAYNESLTDDEIVSIAEEL